MKRRSFLKLSSTAAAASLMPGKSRAEQEDAAAARHKARWRRRRIIMNNDGNEFNRLKPEEPRTPENFLSKRTTPLAGSQVDSIFYCTGVFNLYTHRSEETEVLTHPDPERRFAHELHKLGTDPLEIMTSHCHDHGREVFWSMRMNDTHDSGDPALFCQWKQEHPEYLAGKKGWKYLYGCNRWSSVNYDVPEVRDKVFRIFRDVCTRYDVDGIEMDFFRHPVLFKEQMVGKPITQEQCDKMTALVKRIRKMADGVAAKRGRPLLIGVRLPDSIGYCKAMGIDLVRWMEEDLIDLAAGSGYFKLEPWTNWAAMGEKYGIPVYACFCSRRIMNGGQPEADTAIKIWRGEALNAWEAGVDGIYTFNRFNPRDRIFRELGDPDLLRSLEHTGQESFVADIWSRPERWLKNGGRFVKKPSQT
jgi:hypothetical protein